MPAVKRDEVVVKLIQKTPKSRDWNSRVRKERDRIIIFTDQSTSKSQGYKVTNEVGYTPIYR